MAPRRQGEKRPPSRGPKRYGSVELQRAVPLASAAPDRTEFRRDFGRLLHCPSFRRLQGKTQLFPGTENDFFRNRLTHSLEVAQIGKSIANLVNNRFYRREPKLQIDTDLVEFACLAHDIGHPPFGHVGEYALDACMREYGGFEGNAQTFRIISRLEKRELRQFRGANGAEPAHGGHDLRAGLNVTYRSLASVLKYDRVITPVRSKHDTLAKGYYYFDHDLVQEIKVSILGKDAAQNIRQLRTVECSIMDTADDIAYSTYDLEDTFKSNLLTPLGFWLLSRDTPLMQQIAKKIGDKIREFYPGARPDFTAQDVISIMYDFFKVWFKIDADAALTGSDDIESLWAYLAVQLSRASREVATDGYKRTKFTSSLVDNALRNIELVKSPIHPALDQVRLKLPKFKEVEVLKSLNFATVISSPLMKTIEYRGKKIVEELFSVLGTPEGSRLLPEDQKFLYDHFPEPSMKKRVICDFIAGMTDRYALEVYDRLNSTKPGSIYKPHN